MKTLLRRFLPVTMFLALASSVALASEGWETDYEKALAQAKTEKKMVLLDFTGSDWCGWCKKLDKEVFSQQEFKDYAKKNVVLVELDFPRTKQIPEKTKEQNQRLAKQFAIRGYPTIIVLNSEGQQIGKLGYRPGGPAAFTAALDQLKGK